MPMPVPSTSAPSPAASDLLALPEQAHALGGQLVAWLRSDSLQALIGVGAALLVYALLVAVREGAKRAFGRDEPVGSWRGVAFKVVRRTRSFFLAAAAARLVAGSVAAPGLVLSAVGFLFTVAAAFQGAIWLRELLLALVERRAHAQEDENGTLASAMGVIRVLVNVAVWALALILVLDNLGVNVTALVAGLGIGGIAIGLAAQGIFSDLFAALAILFDRPFRRGDTIQFAGTTGTVESIGLKTTRLRATSGEEVVISNTKLLSDQIRNLRRIEERNVTMLFQLELGSDPALLARVPTILREAVEAAPNTRFQRAHVHNASASAVEAELGFAVTTADFIAMMDARQAILLHALSGLRAAGLHPADSTPPRG